MHAGKASLIIDSIRKFLRRGAKNKAVNVLGKMHPGDFPLIFNRFEKEEQKSLFSAVCKADMKLAAELIKQLQKAEITELIKELEPREVGSIFENLAPDDAVEMLSLLPEDQAAEIKAKLDPKRAAEISKLLDYPEETAGRIMIPDFFALPENTTCQEAIDALRHFGDEEHENMEMVFYVYVVDDEQRLKGIVSMRQLIINPPGVALGEILSSNVIYVYANEDQEEVARMAARYDLLAIPVVNEDMKMLGIVTIDDVVDVLREEATEDFFKLAGTDEEEILSKSVFKSARYRFLWLSFSLIGGIINYMIIAAFDTTIAQIAVLAAFIPVILNMGGNVGNQSATIMVRGLATGRISLKQWWLAVWKEMQTAGLLGLAYGLTLGTVAVVLEKQILMFGLVLGFSLFFSMTFAASLGAGLPVMFKKIGVDPAVATGPLVMTSVDVIGVLVYLVSATVWLLPLLT